MKAVRVLVGVLWEADLLPAQGELIALHNTAESIDVFVHQVERSAKEAGMSAKGQKLALLVSRAEACDVTRTLRRAKILTNIIPDFSGGNSG